eukprot:3144470-Amphidinium_carterae.1
MDCSLGLASPPCLVTIPDSNGLPSWAIHPPNQPTVPPVVHQIDIAPGPGDPQTAVEAANAARDNSAFQT